MAPNPKVTNAFRAMKALGIPEYKVKPVLKNLLKLYDKNWNLIEEENYRALADAIFEHDDEAPPPDRNSLTNLEENIQQKEDQPPAEPERPLKRLRRGHNSHAANNNSNSNSNNNNNVDNCLGGVLLKEPKLEQEELPVPAIDKGKKPLLHQPTSKEKRAAAGRSSLGVRFKEPVAGPPKQKRADSHGLIIPKEEPFTDDLPLNEVPLAVIYPDSSSKKNPSTDSMPMERPDDRVPPASQSVIKDVRDNVPAPSVGVRTNGKHTSISEEIPTNVKLATSALGEEAINSMPAGTANGLADDNCSEVSAPQIPEQPRDSNKEILARDRPECEQGDNSRGPELSSLAVGPESQLSPKELESLHRPKRNDITKGEEVVEVPWLNEISNVCPPDFNYIPRSLVFQNAELKFTLSQISDEHCCATCMGDCLTSFNKCICSGVTGDGFAYMSNGLLKEDLLEACISMSRDPRRQCLSFCKDCPLELAKSGEMYESCRGHLKRKYIKECWIKCGCHMQCGNRVVQHGIKYKLQVFFTPDGKGWGLRTLEKLPKGAFVCQYVGEILTIKEFYARKMSRNSKTRQNTSPVILDAYWHMQRTQRDEAALCLDATFYGNVARFINHRCLDANLIEIPVKIETADHHYYHLALFTTREVNAMEELTWDYGIDFDDKEHPIEAFRCYCGSKFCRNIKRSNKPTSAL